MRKRERPLDWVKQSQVKYCTFGYFQKKTKKVNIKNEEITKKLNAHCTAQHHNDCGGKLYDVERSENPNFVYMYTKTYCVVSAQSTVSTNNRKRPWWNVFPYAFDFCCVNIVLCAVCCVCVWTKISIKSSNNVRCLNSFISL